MSNYKERSDYFKLIAHNNILIAHDRNYIVDQNGVIVYTEDGQVVETDNMKTRKSFHRVNNEAELNAACKDWAHFPCVVHIGHDIRWKSMGTSLPHRVNGNHLHFLTKLDTKKYPYKADAIEAAYDEAAEAMEQFLSYMREDLETNGVCGNLFLFDLANANAEQIGPVNSNLYGWYLMFADEKKAYELNYYSSKWFEGPAAM
jgi:hypothetical protein